ncbi:MAG: VanW family protein [Firmicutes bacterium]|nr:VanW family protein [Bacillota bacterium]
MARTRMKTPADFPYLLFRHNSPLARPSRAAEEYQANKAHNLQIACRKIDGIVVRPGEVLSFCRLVGPTPRSRGYFPALTLIGDRLQALTGGGLCQLSNMIYWMALHLGFETVERHRHSYDLFPDVNRTVPFGCGATVFYNYVDLVVKNTLEFPVGFGFRVMDGMLVGEAYGACPLPFEVRVYETDHEYYDSVDGKRRRNKIWRRVAGPGGPPRVELVAENDCRVTYEVSV